MKKILIIIAALIVCGLLGYGYTIWRDAQTEEENLEAKNEEELSGSVTQIRKEGKIKLVDTETGKTILDGLEADWLHKNDDSLAIYAKGNKRGIVNIKNGKIIVPPTYRRAWSYSNGLAGVELYGKIGFINTEGKVVIGFKFPFKGNKLTEFVFHNGHCLVSYQKKNEEKQKLGVIDTLGHWVIKPEYDDIDLAKDYAIVYKWKEFKKMVDYHGNVLQENIVDDIYNLYYKKSYINTQTGAYEDSEVINEKIKKYEVNNLYGLMDTNGTFITSPIYATIEGITPTVFKASLPSSGWWGQNNVLIDINGNVLSQKGKAQKTNTATKK
ncbi:MAG: WG repeat-containing protein [Paludibacteraceae bacterium]|nr:WG repeat-containing protein [Paludibacteraceae bacterium]